MAERPGIYCIRHLPSGKVYIGSSIDAPRRMYVHRWLLSKGKHFSIRLQRAYRRDGLDAFSFSIIEWCSPEALLIREQAWLDKLHSINPERGYNLCAIAGTRAGVPQPESVAQKMRAVHSGKPKTPEQRAKMSAASKGKPKSEIHRRRISEAVKRQMADPKRRAAAAVYGRMAKPYWKGKKLPDHVVEQIRARSKRRAHGPDGKFL